MSRDMSWDSEIFSIKESHKSIQKEGKKQAESIRKKLNSKRKKLKTKEEKRKLKAKRKKKKRKAMESSFKPQRGSFIVNIIIKIEENKDYLVTEEPIMTDRDLIEEKAPSLPDSVCISH